MEPNKTLWDRVNRNSSNIAEIDKNLALCAQNLKNLTKLVEKQVENQSQNRRDWKLAAIGLIGRAVAYTAVGIASYIIATMVKSGV